MTCIHQTQQYLDIGQNIVFVLLTNILEYSAVHRVSFVLWITNISEFNIASPGNEIA